MKPFNLEAALRGEPVVTRDGRKATQVTKFDVALGSDSVVAVIDGHVFSFDGDGRFSANETCYDMFMAERTIRIGDVEVPEPVRDVLENGKCYWIADTSSIVVRPYCWESDDFDFLLLRRGLIHRTKEAAGTHIDALIKISGGTP